MDVARLVLDYFEALVWPALVIFVLVRFRRGIASFIGRIAGESREFSASGFGLAINAKFQEQLATLAEQSETADPGELRESVKRTARDFSRDQFRRLVAAFTELPLAERQEAAKEIGRLAPSIELDELLDFARSFHSGERLGAAIGLRVHMQRSGVTQGDERVASALGELLNDRSSFVRYRAAEAVRAMPQLVPKFEDDLNALAKRDPNSYVRDIARKALGQKPR
jgi:transposase